MPFQLCEGTAGGCACVFSESYPLLPALVLTTRCTFCDEALLKSALMDSVTFPKSLASLYRVSPEAYKKAIARLPQNAQQEMRRATLAVLQESVAKGSKKILAQRVVQIRRDTMSVLDSTCAMRVRSREIREDGKAFAVAQVLRKRLSVLPMGLVTSYLLGDVGYIMSECKSAQIACQFLHNPLMQKHPRIDGRSCDWAQMETTYRFALIAHANAARDLLLIWELHMRQVEKSLLPLRVRADLLLLLKSCLRDMCAAAADRERFPSKVL